MPTIFDPSQSPSNQPNLLVNGGFQVWQRGTSFVNSLGGSYYADRWQNGNNGNTATFTVSRESTITDGSPFSLKWALTATGGTTVFRIYNYMDDIAPQLAGRTITIRARARVDAGGGGFVAMRIIDTNGATAFSSTTLSGAATWETLNVTRAFAANVTSIILEFSFNNTVGTAYLDNVMAVIGTSGADYMPLDPQQELARCQRYYQRIGGPISGNEIVASGQWWTTTLCDFPIRFPVIMRVTPTVTLAGISGWKVYNAAGSALTPTGIGSFATSAAVVGLTITVASGGVAGNGTILYTTAPTSYLELSADF